MAKISKKLRIKWNFELTVFELTLPDLYCNNICVMLFSHTNLICSGTIGAALNFGYKLLVFKLYSLTNGILLGILDNSFSLIVFLSSRDLRGKLTNWYLINQSVLDLFASIVLLLVTVTVTLSDAFVGFGIGAELHCR